MASNQDPIAQRPELYTSNPPAIQVSERVSLMKPLTRHEGLYHPMILLVDASLDLSSADPNKTLDPPPLQKWAEEGYTVAQVLVAKAEGIEQVNEAVETALEELAKMGKSKIEEEGKEKVGLIAILDEITPGVISVIRSYNSQIAAAVFYTGSHPSAGEDLTIPALIHLPKDGKPATASERTPPRTTGNTKPKLTTHIYPSTTTPYFTIPSLVEKGYNTSAAALSHTRTLTFLKPLLGGPYFDLEAIWEEHAAFEFGDRSVENTMSTMVAEPYVNHVPTLTGGIGRGRLTEFYRDHFIFSNSDDAELQLISRTTGIDRIVDEFLFVCTHDRVIDWL